MPASKLQLVPSKRTILRRGSADRVAPKIRRSTHEAFLERPNCEDIAKDMGVREFSVLEISHYESLLRIQSLDRRLTVIESKLELRRVA